MSKFATVKDLKDWLKLLDNLPEDTPVYLGSHRGAYPATVNELTAIMGLYKGNNYETDYILETVFGTKRPTSPVLCISDGEFGSPLYNKDEWVRLEDVELGKVYRQNGEGDEVNE